MACYNAGVAWRTHEKNPDTGKYPIAFSPPKHERKEAESIPIPCGKCTGCLADESLMWSVRAYHESCEHQFNSFVTLTYDDDHYPEDGQIHREHLQKFFKRARHSYNFRYLACGEYGEKTRRPHYHALIFGQNFNHAKYKYTLGENLYSHTHLEKIWGQGQIMIAEMNLQTIMYTCGYVHKKVGDDDCFRIMSRGRSKVKGTPTGIGASWLLKNYTDIQKTGTVTIEGREFPVPPRYMAWMEKEFKEVKEKRKAVAVQRSLAKTPLSDRNKEKNRKAKLKLRNEGEV